MLKIGDDGAEASKDTRDKATTTEIARRCGVSRTTVWAVLTGKKAVSAATREKVLSAVRDCSYHPPVAKRMLSAHFAKVVAVVVRDVSNPFFAELNAGAQEMLRGSGYHALFHGSDVSLEEDVELLRLFHSSRLAGYIVSAMDDGPACRYIRTIINDGTPVVSVGGEISGATCHVVAADFRGASRLATGHLIASGHRHIAYLAGPPKWTDERVMGYMEALLKHEVEFRDSLIVRAGITALEGYEAARRVLASPKTRPTAVACFNDLVAIGAYRAAYELGLRIPGDLSIVGFDNIQVTDVLGPPLTTVDIHPRRIGTEAARILINAISGKLTEPQTHVVSPELVVRQSVARLAPEDAGN